MIGGDAEAVIAGAPAGGASTPSGVAEDPPPASLGRVVAASSLGTVFEFYDFYLYGSLAAVIAQRFFTRLDEGSALIAALLAFASGFLVRPLGSLIFGGLGDRIGRKHTFLVTLTIMGGSTVLVGCLPDFDSIGIAAPILLVGLRMLQGLAIGGEYGGAVTYVAEHAPAGRRGSATAWIQTTGSIGLLLSLVVIIACRWIFGSHFETWGWRVPFLLSGVLLGISIYVRLRLDESPVFQAMKRQGSVSAAPVREALGQWSNLRLILLVILGATLGQAMVTYAGEIYALYFLTVTLKVNDLTANILIAVGLIVGTPFCILFGRLSDRVGRKPVVLAGCLAAAIGFFPIFTALTHFANPALERAIAAAPVTIKADASQCSLQFDPVGKREFRSSCDIARSALAKAGVPYRTLPGQENALAEVRVGEASLPAFDGRRLTREEFRARQSVYRASVTSRLAKAGYPAKADPAEINHLALAGLLSLLVIFVSAVYGPLAAWLVEFFPARVRYTSMSLPYHIGNGWFGGFLPTIAFAIVAATGDIYSGLWYPVIGCVLCVCVGSVFLPETRGRAISAPPTS